MICKSISLNNRRKQNRKSGGPRRSTSRVSKDRMRAHANVLTMYLVDTDPKKLAMLEFSNSIIHSANNRTDYVSGVSEDSDSDAFGEKLYCAGAFNFVSEKFGDRQQEFAATVIHGAKKVDPVEHYVLSWKKGENPTPEQIKTATKLFLKLMGLPENQAFYAAHSNTRNIHVHIVVNRVNPKDFSLVQAGGKWQVDNIHQAVSIIEYEQGWSSEPEAKYIANDKGVFDQESGLQVRDANFRSIRNSKKKFAEAREQAREKIKDQPVEESLGEGAKSFERRTGLQSLERLIKTIAKPILETARSWQDLHEQLGKHGMAYRPHGENGARIHRGNQALSATTAHRNFSRAAMSDRAGFGPYVGPRSQTQIAKPVAVPLPARKQQEQYDLARKLREGKNAELQDILRKQKARTIACIKAQDFLESRELAEAGRADAAEIRQIGEVIRKKETKRILEAVNYEYAAALKRAARLAVFPHYDRWAADKEVQEFDVATFDFPNILSDESARRKTAKARCEQFHIVPSGREYHHYDPSGQLAFRDIGSAILLTEPTQEVNARAAMLVANAKWGKIGFVAGNKKFKILCAEIAHEEGIVITDPGMQKYIAAATVKAEARQSRSVEDPKASARPVVVVAEQTTEPKDSSLPNRPADAATAAHAEVVANPATKHASDTSEKLQPSKEPEVPPTQTLASTQEPRQKIPNGIDTDTISAPRDVPEEQPRGSRNVSDPMSQFRGVNPLIDEWLTKYDAMELIRKHNASRSDDDPAKLGHLKEMPSLRSLAQKIMQDSQAKSIQSEMKAEGLPLASEIQRQSNYLVNLQRQQGQGLGW
ncbi:MAG: hypothetical protein ACI9KA_000227 [Parasphingorhabdus sp.]|jgi:hypothetical protein